MPLRKRGTDGSNPSPSTRESANHRFLSGGIAHQVHRAISFTHGHDLPRLTRRLWSWRDEFANESRWSLELGKQAIAACCRRPRRLAGILVAAVAGGETPWAL
jgi:hypothetical protein